MTLTASPSTEQWQRVTFAGVLYDIAERLLTMSYGTFAQRERSHLRRAAQQLSLMGEQVECGAKTVAEGEDWIAAARVFIYEWTVQHATK